MISQFYNGGLLNTEAIIKSLFVRATIELFIINYYLIITQYSMYAWNRVHFDTLSEENDHSMGKMH